MGWIDNLPLIAIGIVEFGIATHGIRYQGVRLVINKSLDTIKCRPQYIEH